mgnify:CR=1 FL=1
MKDAWYNVLQAAAAYRQIGGFEAERQTEEDKKAAIPLQQLDYVYADANGALFITEKGMDALAAETIVREHAAKREANERKQEEQLNKRDAASARRSWAQVWVQILANLLIFILGILAEHYGRIFQLLMKLLDK